MVIEPALECCFTQSNILIGVMVDIDRGFIDH